MDLTPFKSLFGEDLPNIEANTVGKIRLIKMLRHKFGVNYRNFPQAKKLIDYFNSEMEFNKKVIKIRSGRDGS